MARQPGKKQSELSPEEAERRKSAVALSPLITTFGVSLDANSMMRALLRAGVLEMATYDSTSGSGETKAFRRLTVEGEKFGFNRLSIHPIKTEPRFYPEKFPELVDVIATQLRKEADTLLRDRLPIQGE
ncbi:hypothetical protein [Pseudomonas aeruginosa]|uniref:hypothetical protein n=1 Tax=Pseudomonas aeruginosa TaxID=287 RepID=UPI00383B74A6